MQRGNKASVHRSCNIDLYLGVVNHYSKSEIVAEMPGC